MSNKTSPVEPRRCGEGRIVFTAFKGRGNGIPPERVHFCRSKATTTFAKYPLKLMVPQYASDNECHWVYPVTFGGGLVEGDHIHLEVEVKAGCSAMVTTQASTKVYHCPDGNTTQQTLDLKVGPGALLAVVPDHIVCFENAVYRQKQTVKLETDSNLILLDWLTAGRVAMGESWLFKKFESSLSIKVNEELVLKDAFQLTDLPSVSIKDSMERYKVMGSCILLGSKLAEAINRLNLEYGKTNGYGIPCRTDCIVSISPLEYDISGEVIKGCYLRFMAENTTLAFQEIEKMLQPLYPVLGGDPFLNKY